MKNPALLVAAMVALATPAAADWRFTTWGMTPDQVQAVGAGAVVPSGRRDKAVPLMIKGPYEVGGIKFEDVVFIFKDGGLERVAMHGSLFDEGALRRTLAASFGEPALAQRDSLAAGSLESKSFMFRDVAKGNAIELRCFGSCTVIYKKLDQGF